MDILSPSDGHCQYDPGIIRARPVYFLGSPEDNPCGNVGGIGGLEGDAAIIWLFSWRR